jgi:serine/threonine protein kinase
MEDCGLGTLRDEIQKRRERNEPWPEEYLLSFLYTFATVMEAAKKSAVTHKFIYPNNFYKVDNGEYKISDFGFSKSTISTPM